jgi:osmotically-inducible protein OsmY
MRRTRNLVLAACAGLVVAGSACAQNAADEAIDATDTALDATWEGTETVVDTTKEIAGDMATKTDHAAAMTGAAVTDAWITTKVSAQFIDEPLLKGSDIDVDTTEHVVTLNGTVASAAATDRAGAVALDTEGVTRVVNLLTVN